MRRILVTGANKGIGFAIAKGILAAGADTFVFLGARDPQRGAEARRALVDIDASYGERVLLVELDVASDASVAAAADAVRKMLGSGSLYGVVNNAGIGDGAQGMREVLNVNTVGVRRVCEAFLPMLEARGGRLVNVTSASGPMFVAKCSDARRRFFLDASTGWSDLEALMNECLAIEGDNAAFAKHGLGESNSYGLSKACANTYTLQLARRNSSLAVNACTPGFIETDMTRRYVLSQGKTAADLGMKTPDDGARCPLFLLFGQLEGNGRYYGSDGKRSPFDRYRAPGSPEYTGE
jgi:NAD(P)-dependent dehydrogenase (short-subunit alcohol dehydrogenase family)